MDREKLVTLRDAIDVLLAWPEDVRIEIARWLAPEAAKPNGHDRHPPAITLTRPETSLPTKSPPKEHRNKPFNARAADRRLLAVMADNPGGSIPTLAKAAGSSRTATGERLKRLAARGSVDKDVAGRWKLREESPRPANGDGPGPQQPSSSI